MSDETFQLMVAISGAIYDDFVARTSFTFRSEAYELEDGEEGEPCILTRKSDGKQFEVELVAEVAERAA